MYVRKDCGEPDVVLKISEKKFPCHRKVLANQSPYFEAMFTHNFAEKNKEEIEIKDLEPETMEMLLRSIEHGKEVLDDLQCEQVLAILQASSMLQFELLQKDCIDALVHRWLSPDTCLSIMARADALHLTNLYIKARIMALWNFSTIKNTLQFSKLSIDELEDYLQADGLNATGGELEVFEACFSWLQNLDALERNLNSLRALACIRFSDVSLSSVRTMVLSVSQLEEGEVLEVFEYILQQISHTMNSSNSKLIDRDESEPKENISKSTEEQEEILEKAKLLMSRPPRVLPLLPCVVGRCFDPPKPYLVGFKENRLVPLVRLLKAEGSGTTSAEPNGYRVVVKGQDMYIIGGEFLWGHSNWNKSVWRYSQWSESWSFETSLEHQCRHQSVCCLESDIYVMGGFGKYRVIADCVNRYNTISRKWTLCPPLPCAIYSAACCAFKDCVYVFGPQVWSYNAERNNWITLTSCSNLTFNSALPYGDSIYLTGTYSKELMKFDGNTQEFKTVGSFRLNATNICLVHDTIFMFGVDLDLQLQVESYDIKNNTFQVLYYGRTADENAVNWSPSYSIGCFAIMDY